MFRQHLVECDGHHSHDHHNEEKPGPSKETDESILIGGPDNKILHNNFVIEDLSLGSDA